MNKLKKFLLPLLCGALTGVLVTLVVVPNPVHSFLFGSTAYSKISEIEYLVNNNYYKEIDINDISDSIALGYMYGLDDDYAYYFSEEESNKNTQSNEGLGVGAGIVVYSDYETGYLYLYEVSRNSPADKAGLKQGDLIKEINGVVVTKENFNSVLEPFAKEKEVKLTYIRNEKENKASVTPAQYDTQTVFWHMVDGVCYIKITSFIETTADLFEEALEFAEQNNAEGLIFDLRNNGGGLVNTATDMLDLLLPEGDLLFAKYKDKQEVIATSRKGEINLPMAVLTNGETASSSEYFASAIRDFDKGVLIGTKTFGKGIMQTTYTLSDGSSIRMTVATINTKNGETYHGVGLSPDKEITYTEAQKNIFYKLGDSDPHIKEAVKYLKKQGK